MQPPATNNRLSGGGSLDWVQQWLRREPDFDDQESAVQSETLKRGKVEHAAMVGETPVNSSGG